MKYSIKQKNIFFDKSSYLKYNGKSDLHNEEKTHNQKPIHYHYENNNEFLQTPNKNISTYLISKTNSLITETKEFSVGLGLGNVKDFSNSKFHSILIKNEKNKDKIKRLESPKKNENSNIKSILKNKNLSFSHIKKLKSLKSVRFNFSTQCKEKILKENIPLKKIPNNISQNLLQNNFTLIKYGTNNLNKNLKKCSLNKLLKCSSNKLLKSFSRINSSKKLQVNFKGRSLIDKNAMNFGCTEKERKLYNKIKIELDSIENSITQKKRLINKKIEKIEDIKYKLYK